MDIFPFNLVGKARMYIIVVILSVIFLVGFYLNIKNNSLNQVKVSSQISNYTIDLVEKDDFANFLNNRNLFGSDGLLLENSKTKTTVSSIEVALTSIPQDQLVTYWNYPDGTKIGLSSSWKNEDGLLTILIYVQDDDFGLQSSKRGDLFTSQVLRSILHVTRRLDLAEDANSIILDKMKDMDNAKIHWFKINDATK